MGRKEAREPSFPMSPLVSFRFEVESRYAILALIRLSVDFRYTSETHSDSSASAS